MQVSIRQVFGSPKEEGEEGCGRGKVAPPLAKRPAALGAKLKQPAGPGGQESRLSAPLRLLGRRSSEKASCQQIES